MKPNLNSKNFISLTPSTIYFHDNGSPDMFLKMYGC